MKRLTKILAGLSVLAVLMVCTTAVSFAGTAEDKVTVSMKVVDETSFAAIYDELEVSGDLVETNFPDMAKYEPEGVSWLDAAIAAVIKKTGNISDISLGDGSGYAYVASAFGKSMLGSFLNNEAVSSVHTNISDGQNLTMQLYDGGDYNQVCSYFDKAVYYAKPDDTVTVKVNGVAAMAGEVGPLTDGKIMLVNPDDGTMSELDGVSVSNGEVTLSFGAKGVYYISAQGNVTYESWGSEVTSKYYGAYAKIIVGGDSSAKATVSFRAAAPDSFTYINTKLAVTGDLLEKNFPDFAKYEPDGVSYLDAVVAANIAKYGNTDNMSLSDYGYAWINNAFGGSVLGSIVNNIAITSVHSEIKNKDDLVILTYTDGDWTKVYSYFDKKQYSATTGKTFTANLKNFSIMSGQSANMTAATVNKVNLSTGKATAIKGATYSNGKVKIKFTKAGTYYISALGKVTYSDDYGEYTDKDAYGAFAKVVVKDAVPAKPVIKSAKRTTKKKATVVWKKAKNAKKYKVAYKKAGAKKWTYKTTSKTKIVLKKLNAKKKYQVKVMSINGSAKSKYSKVKTIKIKK